MSACINKKLRPAFMSIKSAKDDNKDSWFSAKFIPIVYTQHQKEYDLIKPFSFWQVAKRYSKISSLYITIVPTFSVVTSGRLDIRIYDRRRLVEDPLSKLIEFSLPVTEKKTFLIEDFGTVPANVKSPIRVTIEAQVSGIKYNQVVSHIRIQPSFIYTNSPYMPKTLKCTEITQEGAQKCELKERVIRTQSFRASGIKLAF